MEIKYQNELREQVKRTLQVYDIVGKTGNLKYYYTIDESYPSEYREKLDKMMELINANKTEEEIIKELLPSLDSKTTEGYLLDEALPNLTNLKPYIGQLEGKRENLEKIIFKMLDDFREEYKLDYANMREDGLYIGVNGIRSEF